MENGGGAERVVEWYQNSQKFSAWSLSVRSDRKCIHLSINCLCSYETMMIFFTIWIFAGGLVTLVLTLNLGPRTGITTENGTGSVWHFYTYAFRNKF